MQARDLGEESFLRYVGRLSERPPQVHYDLRTIAGVRRLARPSMRKHPERGSRPKPHDARLVGARSRIADFRRSDIRASYARHGGFAGRRVPAAASHRYPPIIFAKSVVVVPTDAGPNAFEDRRLASGDAQCAESVVSPPLWRKPHRCGSTLYGPAASVTVARVSSPPAPARMRPKIGPADAAATNRPRRSSLGLRPAPAGQIRRRRPAFDRFCSCPPNRPRAGFFSAAPSWRT
jgi:hypothetical protein